MMNAREYWAKEPTDKIGTEIDDRADKCARYADSAGLYNIWMRAARTLYGYDAEGGTASSLMIAFAGDDGEIVQSRANFYAMFVRTLTVLATGNRPSFQARPRAYDASTTELVGLANAILDMYLDRGVDNTLTTTATHSTTYGEGWTGVYWDPERGNMMAFDPESGRAVFEGDIAVESYRPDEIARDPSVVDGNHEWIGVRRRRSRWTLAMLYPAHADHILSAPGINEAHSFRKSLLPQFDSPTGFDDQVETIEWWHRPSASLPQGRATIVVHGIAIADGPNPYGRIPVYPLAGRRVPGSAFGAAVTQDLLAIQQLVDSVLTQAASMQENFGMQSIVSPPGTSIETEQLSKGMRALYTAQAIDPLMTNGRGVQNAVEFSQYLFGVMQQVMAMNDTSLGAGSTSASGASITAQMNIAARNNAGTIRSYIDHFREVCGAIILTLQKFASVEKTVRIAGKNNVGKIVRWKGESLSGIDGIDVEMIGSAARTAQARYQLMTDLLAAKLISDPEQAMQVYSTGRLEPVFDGPGAREANIERENEMLQRGEEVLVLPQDHHMDHMRRHAALLFDPEMRQNPQLVSIVQRHIYEHSEMWAAMTNDPTQINILVATGQQPSPGAQAMQAMQGQPQEGAPPQGNQPPPDATTNPQGPTETGLPPAGENPGARPLQGMNGGMA